ncbi:MAG: HEPN domain-containing protein [Clostridia bacterium]|jgi:HEPN domain-containing protein
MNNIDLMKYWFESSDSDFDTMKVLFENHKNTWCLFIGHLVIEKLLKGLYAKNNPENPISPKIHNLILLSQKANLEVPNEIKEKIQVINTFNISARYDDYKKTFEEKCTNEYTTLQFKNIEEVQKWLKEQ